MSDSADIPRTARAPCPTCGRVVVIRSGGKIEHHYLNLPSKTHPLGFKLKLCGAADTVHPAYRET